MKIGDVISNYEIIGKAKRRKKQHYYTCKCVNCNNIKEVASSTLIQKKQARGTCSNCHSDKHDLYSTWKSMLNRCNNPNNSSFSYYGGRGISVCDKWRESFWFFVEDIGTRPKGCTLDRKDNFGNYEPSNCRWATHEEQSLNTRRNLEIIYRGKTYTESQLARATGVNRTTIQARRNRGWTDSEELVNGRK